MLTYTLPNNTPPRSYANFLDDLAGTGRARIGLYCGSFNPIHNAHTALCSYLLEKEDLQKILLVVSPRNPFKRQSELMNDDLRLTLARLAVEDAPGIEVSDVEMQLPRPSYTINTILKLKQIYGDKDFVLIMGADNIGRFDHWKDYGRILSETAGIIAFRRPGYENANSPFPQIRIADNPLMDVSSTEIRRKLRDGVQVSGLVCPKVEKYLAGLIGENGYESLFK